MAKMINISGLNQADVFAALFNAAAPRGASFEHYTENSIDRAQAQAMLDKYHCKMFDYEGGRALKFGFDGSDWLNGLCYDEYNGVGSSRAIVADLRKHGDVNSPLIRTIHARNMINSWHQELEILESR